MIIDLMILLELFAGTRSIGKVAEKYGIQVFSVENNPTFGCNMTMSVLDFNPEDYDFIPDILWASPPCTTYSVAAISHHRFEGGGAKTEDAILGDMLVTKTLEIIEYYKRKNPKLVWHVENPRGYLRKMPFMQGLPRYTVTYCQYGDTRMKPTDVWTNSRTWIPKPACSNGDKCHEAAPRGSRTGTQGLKGSKDRSVVPKQLCEEIISNFILNDLPAV